MENNAKDTKYELYYDSAIECVILHVNGTVNLDRIRIIAPEVARLCEEKGCRRLLNDMSKANIHISVLDAYNSPRIMAESGISQVIKRALVLPPSFKESEFLITVTHNRGHDIMAFTDIQKAKEWLLSDR